MELKAKRSSVGDRGSIAKNQIITVDDDREALKLIDTGLYEKYDREAAEKEAREREEEARATAEKEAALALAESQKVSDAANELAKLRTQVSNLTAQNSAKDNSIADLREQIAGHEATVATIPTLKQELEKAKADLANRDAEIVRLTAEVSATSDPSATPEGEAEKKTGAKKAR